MANLRSTLVGALAILTLATLCHADEEGQAFGGRSINRDEFLWFSSIGEGIDVGNFLCSGALISRRHVMTADHCLDGKASDSLWVRIGYFCPRADNCGRTFRIRYVMEIRRDTSLGDIAILVLTSKVPSIFPPAVPDVGSPSILSGVGKGGDMVMVGAGRDGTSDALAKRAETLKVQLHSRKYKTCRDAIRNENVKRDLVSKATICSTSSEGKPCQGDSGSALVVDNVIVAIHSYGPRDCSTADDDKLFGQVAVSAVADFVVSVVCLGNHNNDEMEDWCTTPTSSPISCPSVTVSAETCAPLCQCDSSSPSLAPNSLPTTLRATLRHDFTDFPGPVYSVAFDATSSRLATAHIGNPVGLKVWDPSVGGSALMTVSLDRCCPDSLAFHPDGTILAIDNGSDVALVNMENTSNQDEPRQLTGHTNFANAVTWHPDGTMLASGSSDDTVKLWDIASGTVLHTFQGHQDGVYSVSFDPQGRHLVSAAGDKTLRVWDVSTLQHVRTMEGHTEIVRSVAYSADGARIASGSNDDTVRIWRASDGSPLGAFQVGFAVNSVAWSSDNQFVVSGSNDVIVRVWDVMNMREEALLELEEDSSWVRSVAWSSNGKWIASASLDATVRVWEVSRN